MTFRELLAIYNAEPDDVLDKEIGSSGHKSGITVSALMTRETSYRQLEVTVVVQALDVQGE